MKKNLFYALLVLGLVLTLVPVSALAAPFGDLYVNNEKMSDRGTISCGGGTAEFTDGGTPKLTLTNAQITAAHEVGTEGLAGIYWEGDLTVELIGENTITLTGPQERRVFGILCEGGDAKFIGSGSLTVDVSNPDGQSYGIGVAMTLENEAELTVTGSGKVAGGILGLKSIINRRSIRISTAGTEDDVGLLGGDFLNETGGKLYATAGGTAVRGASCTAAEGQTLLASADKDAKTADMVPSAFDDGKLSVCVGDTDTIAKTVFIGAITEDPADASGVPDTGDDALLWALFGLAALAFAGAGLVLCRKRVPVQDR